MFRDSLDGGTRWTGGLAAITNLTYLRRTTTESGKTGPAFEIDPGKLADEARYDGIFVLRTNARISPLRAVLR